MEFYQTNAQKTFRDLVEESGDPLARIMLLDNDVINPRTFVEKAVYKAIECGDDEQARRYLEWYLTLLRDRIAKGELKDWEREIRERVDKLGISQTITLEVAKEAMAVWLATKLDETTLYRTQQLVMEHVAHMWQWCGDEEESFNALEFMVDHGSLNGRGQREFYEQLFRNAVESLRLARVTEALQFVAQPNIPRGVADLLQRLLFTSLGRRYGGAEIARAMEITEPLRGSEQWVYSYMKGVGHRVGQLRDTVEGIIASVNGCHYEISRVDVPQFNQTEVQVKVFLPVGSLPEGEMGQATKVMCGAVEAYLDGVELHPKFVLLFTVRQADGSTVPLGQYEIPAKGWYLPF